MPVTLGTILALTLAVLVGLTLGLVGGGGSILTLPIFVFVAGVPAQQAVAMSMVVVGVPSLLGAILHGQKGNLHAKAALLFATTGMAGAYGGSYLTHFVSQRVLLGIFAALMFVVGLAMIRGGHKSEAQRRCRVWPCLLIGSLVGILTGLLGVGGGFLIVQALVLFAGIPTKPAVGTSLAVIAFNAAAGFIGQIQHVSIPWWFTLSFLGLAILGMVDGLFVAGKVPDEPLKKGFGWLIIVVALVIAGLLTTGVETTAVS